MRYLIVLVLALIPLCASGSICETLQETLRQIDDKVEPMPTNSPFSIVTSVSTAHQSEILTVGIKSVLSELNIGGFMIHARSTSPPYEVLGRFTSPIAGPTISNCDGENTTVTYHGGSEGEVELQWQAPFDYLGEIFFEATIAQDYDSFWIGITSTPVKIVPSAVRSIGALITSAIRRSNAPTIANELPLANVEQRNGALIYEGCGTTKTCFGLPNNCIEQQSCQAVATAFLIDNRYQFELKSNVDLVTYVALALSENNQMDYDSVMECIREDGVIRAYSSWNDRRTNTRVGVPQNIITLLNATYVNGSIYCKLEREAVSTVLGIEFDLRNQNFHFLLAIGTTVTSAAITRHDLGRSASTQPLHIIGNPLDESIYVGCGTTKTCYGMPINCVATRTCEAIVTAVFVDNRPQFELKSSAIGVTYVAVGLSENNQMDYDSVMECIQEEGSVRAFTSWNDRRTNTREGISQNIIRLLNSSFVNGTIYCKIERDPDSVVRQTRFNLLQQNFYFLLATGTTVTSTSLVRHDISRLASAAPVEIIGRPIEDPGFDPIYEGCGTPNKTCFGIPENCVAAESCQAIVTAVVVNEKYEFQMKSGYAGVAYVSFALSQDELMGEDSVIECVAEGGIVRAYTSWNNPRPGFSNTREAVPQDIFTLQRSSYVNGIIYCQVERDASSTIRGKVFDLDNDNFYFMLAIGNSFTSDSISMHNLGRESTPERITFPGRGGAQHAVQISATCIIVWLLGTSFTQFIRGL